jgi:NAD(P)-dependent dehydrogenase (short-subunit alcohol dehydrogenase family)
VAGEDVLGTRLDGRVAVVTGAGTGLGATTAQRLAALGARVGVLDVDGAAAKRMADELAAAGTQAVALECDVADEDAVAAAAAASAEQLGPCYALVNNAGIIGWTPLEDLPLEDWERMMAVNLRGAFLCTKHFGRQMLAERRGSIVNVASVAASVPEANAGAYSPSKAGMLMLARQTAVEWGSRGIRANAVSPGIMRTPMAERFNSDPEALATRLRMVATRHIADPAEVAAVIAFLLGDAASYLTAQNIEVDGGLMQMLIKILPRPGTPVDPADA